MPSPLICGFLSVAFSTVRTVNKASFPWSERQYLPYSSVLIKPLSLVKWCCRCPLLSKPVFFFKSANPIEPSLRTLRLVCVLDAQVHRRLLHVVCHSQLAFHLPLSVDPQIVMSMIPNLFNPSFVDLLKQPMKA